MVVVKPKKHDLLTGPHTSTMQTKNLQLLQNSLQAYGWRSQATASNLANIDTPGYDRISVSFEDQLRKVRHQVPSLRDAEDVEPRMEVEDGPPILEDEMMIMADLQMRTQFATRALREHFELMRTGIRGRSE